MDIRKNGTYEQYPAAIIAVSTLLPLALYAAGILLLLGLGILWVAAYLVLIIGLEYRLIGGHCRDCYYYGKACAFGKGRVSALFFPRGDPEKFCRMTVSWKDIVPDFLVILVPVLAGVSLLITGFTLIVLLLVILTFVLGFAGNAFVRRNLACRHCRQRIIGCPAEALFNKKS